MVIRFLANAAAIALATLLLPGISLTARDTQSQIIAILIVAVIFGVVNAIVKPFFKFVTAPIILITLGLFLLVVNAALLLLTSWLASQIGIGWHVADFWSAVFGGLIVSTVSFMFNAFFGDKKEEEHRG